MNPAQTAVIDALAAGVQGSTPRAFLRTDCSGHTVWLQLPKQELFAYLKHYRRCKEHDPSTAACVLVPAVRGKFRSLLSGMVCNCCGLSLKAVKLNALIARSGRHLLNLANFGMIHHLLTRYNSIAVFVDRLTKMVHAVACRNTITAEGTADLFFDNIVPFMGCRRQSSRIAGHSLQERSCPLC
jgi:hypothetical protein